MSKLFHEGVPDCTFRDVVTSKDATDNHFLAHQHNMRYENSRRNDDELAIVKLAAKLNLVKSVDESSADFKFRVETECLSNKEIKMSHKINLTENDTFKATSLRIMLKAKVWYITNNGEPMKASGKTLKGLKDNDICTLFYISKPIASNDVNAEKLSNHIVELRKFETKKGKVGGHLYLNGVRWEQDGRELVAFADSKKANQYFVSSVIPSPQAEVQIDTIE